MQRQKAAGAAFIASKEVAKFFAPIFKRFLDSAPVPRESPWGRPRVHEVWIFHKVRPISGLKAGWGQKKGGPGRRGRAPLEDPLFTTYARLRKRTPR